MKLAEAFDIFMYEQRFRNNSPATIEYYHANIGAFIDWLSIENVEDLSIKEYKDYVIYLSSCGLKATSVNTNIRAVKAFYNFLIDEEKIGDCSHKLKLVKARKEEIIPLSDDEILQLLGCFNVSDILELRNKCFVLLMLDRCGHNAHFIKSQEPKTVIHGNLNFYFSESSFLQRQKHYRLRQKVQALPEEFQVYVENNDFGDVKWEYNALYRH